MTILPTATVERLIRSAGAYRVSEAAARELAEVLDEIGKNLSKDAMALAEHVRFGCIEYCYDSWDPGGPLTARVRNWAAARRPRGCRLHRRLCPPGHPVELRLRDDDPHLSPLSG